MHPEQARVYLKTGTLVGLVASLLVAFPTGDSQAKMVGRYQRVTLASMEGLFQGTRLADVTVIGQPNVSKRWLENSDPTARGVKLLSIWNL